MTESSVLRGVINPKKSGFISLNQLTSNSQTVFDGVKMLRKRSTFNYVCREFIWKIGRWKTKSLKDFITEVRPDLIYIPIYSSGYVIDIQKYVIKQAKVPVVGHISDEIYAYTNRWASTPFKNIYRFWIRKKIRGIISKISYAEVFAQDMAIAYSKIFHRKFYVIGKGINPAILKENIDYQPKDTIDFVFTGNYGGERGRLLIELAKAIKICFKNSVKTPQLLIYSTSNADERTNELLAGAGCVKFMGSIYGDELFKVQRMADYLVHVEGFDAQSIMEAKYSFSTKIIDYLSAQRPIFAIGSDKVNSIKVLIDNNMAIVSTDVNSLYSNLERIAHKTVDDALYVTNGLKYLYAKRDIKKIQSEMLRRFKILTDEKSID